MTVSEMKERKKELGYTNEYIARLSGVPLGTVCKVFSGATERPRRATLLALEAVLVGRNPARNTARRYSAGGEKEAADPEKTGEQLKEQILGTKPGERIGETVGYLVRYGQGGAVYWEPVEGIPEKKGMHKNEAKAKLVREPEPAYANIPSFLMRTERLSKAQGEYTVEDYLGLPEDVRVELINGYFYNMASPTAVHQKIVTSVLQQLENYVDRNEGVCVPFCAPLDVQLCGDDTCMVQPDVLVLCEPERLLKNGRVYGAPDFVAEVLSESNRMYDLGLKLGEYARAGVREYWIIDPENREICAYDFEKGRLPKLYTFEDEVPVMIWDGECKVDFRKIAKKLAKLPEE